MIAAAVFWLCLGGVLYTYLGYPALLALLARLRPAPLPAAPPADRLPGLTLLIAAYNEQEMIARKLDNSLTLDYPAERLQVLVAADGSDDRTPEIVRGYAGRGVELSYQPRRAGKMAALNRALPLARGEVVVFSDANNLYPADALRELAAGFTSPRIGAVSGAKIVAGTGGGLGGAEGLYWKYESFIKQCESRLGSCAGVAGEILAIRRDLVEPAPEVIINDDFYLAMRLIQRGYQVKYAPRARSVEHVSATAGDERLRRSRIIAGRYQAIARAGELLPWKQPLVVWQIVSHKFLRPLVPLAMLGALLAGLASLAWPAPARGGPSDLLRLAPPYNAAIFGLQLAFYGLAAVGARLRGRGRLERLLYLPAFLVSSNWAALEGLGRYLAGRQTSLWQRARRGGPEDRT